MIDALLSALKPNTLILTPNQRLAATLLKKYNQQQIDQGHACWIRPLIRPLSSWIPELWQQYCAQVMDAHFILLTANQELILWEELIAEAPESEQLLKLSDLAKQAKSAWSILKQWQVNYNHPAFLSTENSRCFQTWARKFAQRCQQQSWIDSASLIELIITYIQEQKIKLPQNIVLLNFTELTPQYQTFLSACQAQGCLIQIIENQQFGLPAGNRFANRRLEPQHNAYLIGLETEEKEIQIMAAWAKNILEREPLARIGCIASELEDKREMILAIFQKAFGKPEFYNISAGRTLASYPVIQQALQLLSLSLQTLSATQLSALLHSPFIGDAEKEMLSRLQCDSYLRRRNINNLSWPAALKEIQHSSCPKLSARLQAYWQQRENQKSSQKISRWMQCFAELLETLGWPGEQSLNSQEYQVVQAWLQLLLETATMDLILAPLSYHQALHYLTVLATKTYFQPESPEAPIQILGQLEGAGLPFDYLWILGLTDTAWPPAPSPNPLIPHELQKNLKMPNASPIRQLEYSQRLMEQFKQSAAEVFFSYSLQNEYEEQKPSPLIAALPRKNLPDLALSTVNTQSHLALQAIVLEQFKDEQAPPLSVEEKLRGGASIFEMQAACPFKAFAKHRLGARAIEETQAGLPAKSRGTIVHKALELFWKEIKNQANLKALPANALQEKIQQVIKAALQQTAAFMDEKSQYNYLVRLRLENLLSQWLKLEKERPPFSVLALEEEKIIEMNQFPIQLRLDRVDELASGEKLIIDYKTRKNCDIQAWFGERLDEPQLPLYCISSQMNISGLAFGQIHSSKVSLKGLAAHELDLPEVKPWSEKTKADAPNWEAQLEIWRQHIQNLFADFQQGKAQVDPKHAEETCRQCDLQTLCRIHELTNRYDE